MALTPSSLHRQPVVSQDGLIRDFINDIQV